GWRVWQFFFAGNFFREIIVGPIAFQGRLTDKTEAFNAEVVLRDRKRIRATDFGDLHAVDPLPACYGEIRIGRRAQEITIEAGLLREAGSLLERSARVRQL